MSDDNEPRIEFPCDYPIKVIGESGPAFTAEILAIMQEFDATLHEGKVTERPSSKGNYQAITVMFWATGKAQLQAMFDALKAHESVRLVL